MSQQKTRETRDVFRSKMGFVVACIGSAVGMGNIWMFPYRRKIWRSRISDPVFYLYTCAGIFRRDR